MAALNANPQTADFMRRFNVPFPVGEVSQSSGIDPRDFMQLPVMVRASVPWKVIADRKGMIRAQFTGEEPHFTKEEADTAMWADKLLAEAASKGGGVKSRK